MTPICVTYPTEPIADDVDVDVEAEWEIPHNVSDASEINNNLIFAFGDNSNASSCVINTRIRETNNHFAFGKKFLHWWRNGKRRKRRHDGKKERHEAKARRKKLDFLRQLASSEVGMSEHHNEFHFFTSFDVHKKCRKKRQTLLERQDKTRFQLPIFIHNFFTFETIF